MTEEDMPAYYSGQPVQIKEGHFKGEEGIFLFSCGAGQCRIQIKFWTVTLPHSFVLPSS
jgi:hypothetical protein